MSLILSVNILPSLSLECVLITELYHGLSSVWIVTSFEGMQSLTKPRNASWNSLATSSIGASLIKFKSKDSIYSFNC